METIKKKVSELIETKPYIKYGLNEGLINYSALARKLRSEWGKQEDNVPNEDSVMMAIKRYSDESHFVRDVQPKIESILHKTKVSMQEGFSYALIPYSHESFDILTEFCKKSEWRSHNEIRTMIATASNIGMLLQTEKVEEIRNLIGNKEEVEVQDGKAVITVSLPAEASTQPEVFGEVTAALYKEGLLFEIFSMPPEHHLVVDEKDIVKAYDAIKKIVKS